MRRRKSRGPVRKAIQIIRRRWRRWRADVHIVSYPKCGRTWLVLLIAKSLEGHYGIRRSNPLRLRDYHSWLRGIPYMHPHHDGGPEFLLPEEIERDKSAYRSSRVIFMVRDPRDVFVSSYFQKTKRNYDYEGSLADYLQERRGGIESIVMFYNIWAQNRDVPRDFLLVRYEDLHADTAGQLRRVLEFIGIPDVSDPVIRDAVAFCTFDNMRSLEAGNALGTSALSARDASDEETFKTRRGRIGGYVDYLDAASMERLNTYIDGNLDPLYSDYRESAATRTEP